VSQYTINQNNMMLVYGWDQVLGFYLDIFDQSDIPIVEMSTHFPYTTSKRQIVETLKEWNAPVNHIDCINADIPF
jgi:hypothetical protein